MTVEQLREWLKDKPNDAVIVVDEYDYQTGMPSGDYNEAYPVFLPTLNKIRFSDYED